MPSQRFFDPVGATSEKPGLRTPAGHGPAPQALQVSILGKLSGIGRFRLPTELLLIPQRQYRIDPASPPRRNKSRQRRYDNQHYHAGARNRRIIRFDPVELGRH